MSIKKLWTKLFIKNNETAEIALHVSGATVRHKNPFEIIEVPRNEGRLSEAFINKWVLPVYMQHLHDLDDATIRIIANLAKEVNVSIVTQLLGDFNWRTRIVGAYFAAINNYKELDHIIGMHLLKSEVAYAGAGYCLALTNFATGNSKDYLIKYLDYYLDKMDLWFDQAEAYCALELLDKNASEKLITKWNSFVSNKQNWSLERSKGHFSTCLMTLKKIRQLKNN